MKAQVTSHDMLDQVKVRLIEESERECHPNLASKVLSLALRRLGRDWTRHWGHPVLVVESFVDESRYRGTCYRACHFARGGKLSGFRGCLQAADPAAAPRPGLSL